LISITCSCKFSNKWHTVNNFNTIKGITLNIFIANNLKLLNLLSLEKPWNHFCPDKLPIHNILVHKCSAHESFIELDIIFIFTIMKQTQSMMNVNNKSTICNITTSLNIAKYASYCLKKKITRVVFSNLASNDKH